MSEIWSEKEINYCVRAYLWMRECEQAGEKVKKKKVEQALRAGPLHQRGRLDRRMANISFVMRELGHDLLTGFKPQENVGPRARPIIEKAIGSYLRGLKSSSLDHKCHLSCLVKEIPLDAFRSAASRLAKGEKFNFSDSKYYDVKVGDKLIPPKQLTSLASQIHYGGALRSHNFDGGIKTPAFLRIEAAGFKIVTKDLSEITNPESDSFRSAVEKAKAKPKERPLGNKKPKKHTTTSEQYERDPKVVAHAERRANGICELSNQPAPFTRENGSPFLEVHHIIPLSEGGEDVVHNVAALSPNCHREAHYGVRKKEIRNFLLKKIRKLENVR